MKKSDLKKRVKELESSLRSLEKQYVKLEKDKFSIYNLLYRVNKELDEALENKQTFIASMSHELRSPLTAVLGNSALLAQTGLNEQQMQYLNQLNESADFLMSLLSDLLDVSKLKESKVALNLQETHLDKLLIHCAKMVESKIADGVEFIVDIPKLPYYTFTDKKRVQQIFINLLTNAAKFTKKGKIEFRLLEIVQIDKQLEVTVEVKDTGIGIPKSIKETLFQPFSSTDVEEGTGLGLFISHELVTLMGGNIKVDSKVGKGTTFQVTFFCEKSALKMRNLITNSFFPKSQFKRDYSHLKILIVEDLEINREFLKEMFKVFFSITVETAENGKVAIEKVKANSYDIVFMDMRMPILNGVEATKKIRTFNAEVPIVCMSANVYREDKYEAQLAGMNGFIEKPLEYTDIERQLKQLDFYPNKETSSISRERAITHFKSYFDESTSLKLMQMAEDGLKREIKNIETYLLERDTKRLRDTFHAIKGILSNLGLEELSQRAELLQEYANVNDFVNIEKRVEFFLTKIREFFI